MADTKPAPASVTTQQQKDRTVSFNQYLDLKCNIVLDSNRQLTGVIVGWDSLNLVVHQATETQLVRASATTPEREITRSFPHPILVRCQNIESIFPLEEAPATTATTEWEAD